MTDHQAAENSSFVYAIVRNIPKSFRSKDLRRFFSTFVEERRFDCFHFRHRPELKTTKNAEPSTSVISKAETSCCIVRLTAKNRTRLIRRYSGEHWADLSQPGDAALLKCIISPVKGPDSSGGDGQAMIELNPPSLMPQGNVGTPSEFFLDLIKTCRLPANLIGKLDLTFPRAANGRRTYGRMPLEYEKSRKTTHEEVDEDEIVRNQRGEDPDDGEDIDDDRCQEYERHEALNEDVTSQERAKERMYEEEMEVVWEKGGSGLVFYTDAFQWDQQKGTDTDERWTDDWDVDMSVYYPEDGQEGSSSGTRDARDMLDIRRGTMFRNGQLDESVFKKKVQPSIEYSGDSKKNVQEVKAKKSEKVSSDVARRVMEKYGWRQGQGLGRDSAGKVDPAAVEMEADAQKPLSKVGLGYRGEKLQRFGLAKRPAKHSITTMYDSAPDVDPQEGLLRQLESTQKRRRL